MTLHVHDDVAQGTDEWHALRRGLVTASTVGKLLTVGAPGATAYECPRCSSAPDHPCISLTKKTPAPIKTVHPERAAVAVEKAPTAEPVVSVADNDTSRALTLTLIAERIAGWSDPSYVNDDMMRGILHEPVARDRYAEHNGVGVDEVGFLVRDDWGFSIGASPDGLVGEDGGLEVKCPRAKSHIATIVADEVPAKYMPQIQACLLVSGRQWWDYVSFCAGLPMWTKRVEVDASWQAAIVAAVTAFEGEASRIEGSYWPRAEQLPKTDRIHDDVLVVA